MRAMARTSDGRDRAGRDQGGRRRLSAVRRGPARSRRPLGRRARRSATASSAPPPIRRCWRGSISKPGARITVGDATIELRAALAAEPDKLASGIGFGPRLLIGHEALRATGLVQPGSLVRWHYRLRLAATTPANPPCKRVGRGAATQLPDAGWEVRSRTNASPALETQHRALHPIPDAGRPHRAAGRRRRRRQCGAAASSTASATRSPP